MLFVIEFTPRSGVSEERDKRSLKLFRNWKPPAGIEFKAFYDYADGNGGVALVEAGTADALLELTAPWSTFFEFTARVVVPVETATAIYEKALAWRDTIPCARPRARGLAESMRSARR